MEGFFIIFIIIFIPFAFYMAIKGYKDEKAAKEYNAKQEVERQRRQLQREIDKQKRKNDFSHKVNELTSQYGEANFVSKLSDQYLEECIISFNSTQHILINERMVKFEDIISCELIDDPRIIKGKVTYETKKDTADMWGRAGLGQLLDGSRGAQIGALTAKQKTIEKREPDKVYHRFRLHIHINDLDNPLLEVKFGDKESVARRAYAFINVIATRNTPK